MEEHRKHRIDSAAAMVAAVRHFGIIPFFKCGVPGWSVEELTPPEHWFFSSDELGPWDWKIDVVREGDIAYGKFLGGKAAFATVEFYAHLMNWRRSLPKYRAALGEKHPAKTRSEKLMKVLSPAALSLIKENGAASSTEIRAAVTAAVTPSLIRSLGASYKANLVPVKKSVCDTVVQFLEMGTWTVIGDFTRVYRGPNAEYSGWQRSSHATPDALFGNPAASGRAATVDATVPFWAKFIDPTMGEDNPMTTPSSSGTDRPRNPLELDCTPAESREFLIRHVRSFFPDADDKTLSKIF